MSLMTVETGVRPVQIAQPAPNYGVIALLLLSSIAIVVALSSPTVDGTAAFIDQAVPQVVTMYGP
jgi:hypothetical protein